ncbi:MAG: D-alanyl-D-alanine carboxypeptidase, partial [Gemmatimonadota bacterium]
MRSIPSLFVSLSLFTLAACQPVGDPSTRPAPAIAPRVAFRALADSLLDDRRFRSANWGVLVVDPSTGDTLYSRNAGKLFMPASNQKLITGAVALARLGADFRYETRVLGSASVRDGILPGDLAVLGSGDPSYTDSLAGGDAMAPLRALADALTARGIRRHDLFPVRFMLSPTSVSTIGCRSVPASRCASVKSGSLMGRSRLGATPSRAKNQ